MNYANPVFPNVNPYMASNVGPAMKTSQAPMAAPYAAPGGCHHRYAGPVSSTGSILVLFILLVIITRAWMI